MGFEHRLGPPRWLRFLVVAFAAVAACGIAIAVSDTATRWGVLPAALLGACGVAALGAGGLAWRRSLASRLRLVVDADGDARLHDERQGGSSPVSPRSWLLGDRFVALTLVLDEAPGRRLHVLAGPDTPDADDWRRLRAWLAWGRRGGLSTGSGPGGPRAAS